MYCPCTRKKSCWEPGLPSPQPPSATEGNTQVYIGGSTPKLSTAPLQQKKEQPRPLYEKLLSKDPSGATLSKRSKRSDGTSQRNAYGGEINPDMVGPVHSPNFATQRLLLSTWADIGYLDPRAACEAVVGLPGEGCREVKMEDT